MWIGMIALALVFFPALGRKPLKQWRGALFAHRGYYGNGRAENTLEAFEAACQLGVGIEMDVRLSADGELVVFHDETLLRMAGDPRAVCEVPLEELRALCLMGGEGRIPTLAEALAVVRGRVPLLIEVKRCRGWRYLCAGVAEALREYGGVYLLESFDPRAVRILKHRCENAPCGLLVAQPQKDRFHILARLLAAVYNGLLCRHMICADFIARDLRLPNMRWRLPTAVWTVRDAEACAAALARGDMAIFEGFRPLQHQIEAQPHRAAQQHDEYGVGMLEAKQRQRPNDQRGVDPVDIAQRGSRAAKRRHA